MLTGISWNNYIVVVVLILTVWYLFVGFRYYFGEIKEFVTGKRKLKFRAFSKKSIEAPYSDFSSANSKDILNSQDEFETADTVFNEVEELVIKLKNSITEATQKNFSKKDFEDCLQLILKEHSLISNSPFRSSINELIVSECEIQDSILLTYQEIEALWNKKK
ncbi:hypothetical protein [Flavobacterium sp.]|uniref:hypothetical protein n=1 Tax=Flavobacterium sp. TaxID=239 RepID=UPI003C46AC2A